MLISTSEGIINTDNLIRAKLSRQVMTRTKATALWREYYAADSIEDVYNAGQYAQVSALYLDMAQECIKLIGKEADKVYNFLLNECAASFEHVPIDPQRTITQENKPKDDLPF